MHELAVTEQILKLACAHGEEAKADAVTRVKLAIGRKSGYALEPIQFYFGMMAEGTLCEGAELEFESSSENEFYLDSIEVIE